MKKKNTNAGINALSAKVSHCSLTIVETRSQPPASARATNCEMLSGAWTISASLNSTKSGWKDSAFATPSASAQSLPVQPSAIGRAWMTVNNSGPELSRATSAVRSSL